MNRLREKYNKDIKFGLKKELKYKNIMMVPKLEKIVVNSGVGEATRNVKILDKVMEELAIVTGQKPVLRRAKNQLHLSG